MRCAACAALPARALRDELDIDDAINSTPERGPSISRRGAPQRGQAADVPDVGGRWTHTRSKSVPAPLGIQIRTYPQPSETAKVTAADRADVDLSGAQHLSGRYRGSLRTPPCRPMRSPRRGAVSIPSPGALEQRVCGPIARSGSTHRPGHVALAPVDRDGAELTKGDVPADHRWLTTQRSQQERSRVIATVFGDQRDTADDDDQADGGTTRRPRPVPARRWRPRKSAV